MSDISETIQETIQVDRNSINSKVAIFVAITATFMALCNVKDGNVVQAMSQAQAHSINAWSYFEAKSTKQAITEKALELVKIQDNPNKEALIKEYEKKLPFMKKKKRNKSTSRSF